MHRATIDTEVLGSSVSATIRRFNASGHSRRRPTESGLRLASAALFVPAFGVGFHSGSLRRIWSLIVSRPVVAADPLAVDRSCDQPLVTRPATGVGCQVGGQTGPAILRSYP